MARSENPDTSGERGRQQQQQQGTGATQQAAGATPQQGAGATPQQGAGATPQQGAVATGSARQGQMQTQEQGARGAADRERQLPVGREGARRGTALTRPQQQELLPSLFAAPPGLLAGAFLSNPYGFMRRMSEEMNRIFEGAGYGGTPAAMGGTEQSRTATWLPQVEVRQRGDDIVVRADLPGLDRNDVTIEVDDGVLTLSGERRQEEQDEREGYYRSERSYGSFYRAIPLPEGVNEDDISASFDNGVLEVRVPMPQQQQRRARKIDIR